MSDDLLKEAARALRESTEGDEPDTDTLARSRSDILRTLHHERRSSSIRVAFLLPIAAVLAGGTALAAASGRLPELVDRAASALGLAVAPRESSGPGTVARGGARAPAAPRVVATAATAPEPVLAPEPPAAAPASPESPPAARAAASAAPAPAPPGAVPTAHASSGAPGPAPSGSVEPAADALYRRAHEAHFAKKQPAAALALWDEYLAAAPRGRFAVEARYNRALCLVRLGRRAEARAALAPFAEGKVGTYRQEEAQALLAALGGP
ncbi:MAG: hypothetical protein IT376_12660 [Polyangiaceae bacterium]|nr:hypothetical protein [Polyangiaceae bacterium]